MININRRNLLATVCLAGIGVLSFSYSDHFRKTTKWETLDTLPITFGEWELLALDQKNGSILVFDPLNDIMLAKLDVGGSPSGLLHSGSGMAVAVDASNRKMTVFRRNKKLERLTIILDLEPSIVALSPGGNLFAVLDRNKGELSLISSENGEELNRKTGLFDVYSLMFDAFGDTLYMTEKSQSSIRRLEIPKLETISPIDIGGESGLENLMPIQGEDWMIALPLDNKEPEFHLVDFDDHEVKRTFKFPTPVKNVSFDRNRRRLYVSSVSRSEIYIQPLFGTLYLTIQTPTIPDELALSSAGGWLAALSIEHKFLNFYDSSNLTRLYKFTLPEQPITMVHHQWSGKTFVALENSNRLWIIDDNFKVRDIPLNASNPSLFALAGSAICHA